MYKPKVKISFTDSELEEIKKIAELIKDKDYTFLRDLAMMEWMRDFTKTGDMTARSWGVATISYLISQGYEVKKKEKT